MRIAVSGTHGVGKSTLIDEFLRLHPEFEHEPEPYEVMTEEGEEFSEEPCVEDFLRQLEFNLERLGQHARGRHVIYERCPLDFLAYLTALDANVPEALVNFRSHATTRSDRLFAARERRRRRVSEIAKSYGPRAKRDSYLDKRGSR